MNPRVLLIDDLPDVLDSYEDVLRQGSYDFGRARSKAEALDLLDRQGPWDVVLVDERLSGPGGDTTAKNWSTSVDPKEVTAFRAKLRDRYERVRLGIFVSMAGFTKNVSPVLQRQTDHPELVLAMTGEHLAQWIAAANRVEWLKERIAESVMREAS